MANDAPRVSAGVVLALLAIAWSTCAHSQQDYGARLGERRGGAVDFEPQGSGVLLGALDPTVKKWYIPQELYEEYGWQTWQYSNYARNRYQRYVDVALEGDYFYDIYGSYVTRGWLIYDWRQDASTPLGSSIYQDSRYSGWFNRVLIASDAKGGVHYAVTVGDQIRTTLTPLTFSKPTFDGMQLDFLSDRYAGTLLLSRVSGPVLGAILTPDKRTNVTNMAGGRMTAQVGDFMTVGATWVNAHNSRTTLGSFEGNSFKGTLGEGQARVPLTAIAVVLGDDSPEDGEGGAALFSHDVTVVREDFQNGTRRTYRLADLTNDPTRWPIVEGGFQEEGFLSANGQNRIILNYDFTDPSYIGPDPTEIVKVTFDLVLANDYAVQEWSNRQTGASTVPSAPLTGEDIDTKNPVLFTVAQAGGNVKDGSNRQRVIFDYGLPTATQVYGFTVEARDIKGINFSAEYDVKHAYGQYPNLALFTEDRSFSSTSSRAEAWLANVSYRAHPWYFSGEAFSMDPGYSTSAYLVNTNGDTQYDTPGSFRYELVEDNDDQDRYPDWQRLNQGGPDLSVFPGWDENNDYINDFNQNDNRTISNRHPDYEEPFLRYSVDRPEFLFGMDLNNNGWIDRFENDSEPDYPYKRDHQGYNAYGGAFLTPDARFNVGQMREKLLSSGRENTTTYGLFTLDKDYAQLGRIRVFDMLKKAKDNIPDDRLEAQPFLAAGLPANVPDILPAQDTWINSLWLGLDYTHIPGLSFRNKVKYETYVQGADQPRALNRSPMNDDSYFFGLVNKVDYAYRFGQLVVQPRLKNEYSRQQPFIQSASKTRRWMGLESLYMKFPVLRNSAAELGVELAQLRDLVADEDQLLADSVVGPTGDYNELNLALQWSTRTAYQGYRLILQAGFRLSHRSIEGIEVVDLTTSKGTSGETSSATFMSIYAGMDQ